MKNMQYNFTSELWRSSGDGGWYFLTVPADYTIEIRNHLKWAEEGWGRLKVRASIDGYTWDTAVWFDTARNSYLLPVKAQVRKLKSLDTVQPIAVTLWV